MAASRLEDLPRPSGRYRIDRLPGSAFETVEAARAEDATRAELLMRPRKSEADRHRDQLAQCLAGGRGHIPETLASMEYIRGWRISAVGCLWRQCRLTGPPWHLVTLIPTGMSVAPSELAGVDPRQLQQRLRMQLRRAGANPNMNGWMFGFLDGEYNPVTDRLQLHWHLIAAGEDMLRMIDRLRESSAFRSRVRASENVDGVARRVDVRRVLAPGLPGAIKYVVKGTWYARRRGPSDDGLWVCDRRKRRIPEPAHGKVLLWFDKWRVGDMAVMINLRVGRKGLYRI